ncbi:hypothetical protein [Kineococcus sp. NPDC059986]|uniref:hypothetical protein n=1 Tax=Kineococcus sp. NPDC059986 TaxID=3155538 RepID=UPI00344C52AB
MPETTTPVLNQDELARQYGWAQAVLQSDPELQNLFSQAVGETWDPAKFSAKVRETNWYKTHSESWRQNEVLKLTDPTTYASKQEQAKTSFYAMAAQMGADISGGQADGLAQQAFQLGWSEQQVRNALTQFITMSSPNFGGVAGAAAEQLREYAGQMGVRMDDGSIQNWARMEAQAGGTGGGIQMGKQFILQNAVSAFPPLAQRLQAGETVDQIISPYKQSMGNILELSPDSLDAFDPTIRGAILNKNKDGSPGTQSLWEFEQGLRKDARWTKTQNAQNSVMSTARKVLTDFGLAAG